MPAKEVKKPRTKISNTEVSKLLAQIKKSGLAQPVRAQPTPEVMKKTRKKEKFDYLAEITWHSVKHWGKKIIADVKYRGVRGLILVDPDDKKIIIYSRTLKPLVKFKIKYGDKIIRDMANWIDEPTLLDAELFARSKQGDPLPQPVETGWVKNPEGYRNIQPEIKVFDVLVLDGKAVWKLPLERRKELLKKALDYEGGVTYIAQSKLIDNTEKDILTQFKKAVQKKHEGIVLKDPKEPYFFGKGKGNWRKMKEYETLDLRLKRVEAYPADKKFWFFKHWVLTPEDKPAHEIHVDKGIKEANLNTAFYAKFTKWVLDLWRKGKVKGIGKTEIDPNKTVVIDGKRIKLIDYYGRKYVPKYVELPKHLQKIVEIYVEDITPSLIPTGQKIVGLREDKKEADTYKAIKKIHDTWYGTKEEKEFKKTPILVWFDGSYIRNKHGGKASYGFLVVKDGKKIIEDTAPIHEERLSNNVAEYRGLIAALSFLLANKMQDQQIIVHTDSKLLANQMNGRWRAHGGDYYPYYIRAKNLASKFKNLKIKWVPREKNKEADALSRF